MIAQSLEYQAKTIVMEKIIKLTEKYDLKKNDKFFEEDDSDEETENKHCWVWKCISENLNLTMS